jgi:hypothetical protein
MLLVNRKPAQHDADNQLKTLRILNSFSDHLGEVRYYTIDAQFFRISGAIFLSWKGEISGRSLPPVTPSTCASLGCG